MAVESPFPFELFLIGLPLLGGGALIAVLAPRVISTLRQRAYDASAAREMCRWVLRVDPHTNRDPSATRRFIAALHPSVRRGVSRWAVGWPELLLDVMWAGGVATWEIQAPRQLTRVVEAAASAAFPDAQLEPAGERLLPNPDLWLSLSGSAPEGCECACQAVVRADHAIARRTAVPPA